MTFFETVLMVAVVGIGIWLLLGSSPQSRPPHVEQQDRFASRRDDVNTRRRSSK
jgi:hypothetical protein